MVGVTRVNDPRILLILKIKGGMCNKQCYLRIGMTGELEEIITSLITEQINDKKTMHDQYQIDVLVNICTVLENISDTLSKMYSNLL